MFVTTKGFKDVLRIGDQTRSNIFDLKLRKPEVLHEHVIEVDERVTVSRVDGSPRAERAVDAAAVKSALEHAYHQLGLRSVAICFVHSYIFSLHEEEVAKLARQVGFSHISTSSQLVRMVRFERRASTTVADAYLAPLIEDYIQKFKKGFGGASTVKISFMMSDGGLCPVERFSGYKAVLSGPAGGVIGYSRGLPDCGPLIGFDMGGTSTDVSRFDGSSLSHVFNAVISGVKIQAPQLDVTTVAAGGGSRLFFSAGLLQVGPESAGSSPGPVCYRKKGGMLAITDANLVCGRIVPDLFPKIFGPTADQPLDLAGSIKAMNALAQEVNAYRGGSSSSSSSSTTSIMTAEELALGFIQVANEAMCRPIRNITEARGFAAASHSLACFGGAGGQHACAIARMLGIEKVYIHRYASILSAYGIGMADAVEDLQAPIGLPLDEGNSAFCDSIAVQFAQLCEQGKLKLRSDGFTQMRADYFLNLRFKGTDTSLMIAGQSSLVGVEYRAAFEAEYQREFGFLLQERAILVDDVRVRVIANAGALSPSKVAYLPAASPTMVTRCLFRGVGHQSTPVFTLRDLGCAAKVDGPALLVDQTNTILVEPHCQATIMEDGCVFIQVGRISRLGSDVHLVDSVLLSVFAHRFMSVAEQMGRTLQRTSVSTNIKERKDFSCAIFGPTGGLVANAPHLPVHLGSMQEAVRWQIKHLGPQGWHEGYVVVTNHPEAGGTHLPDITVITPVFSDTPQGRKPVFYVASRGHHADIGGISAGSMPPFSKYLEEEGAAFQSFFLVKDGVFQEAGITEILTHTNTKLRFATTKPTGTRDLKNNLCDLQAQVAANQKGILLIRSLIAEYGLDVVLAYMQHVQDNCETAVRDLLRQVYRERNLAEHSFLSSEDYMDDGTKIALRISIDPVAGSAVFDFTGTGPQMHGNLNAPRAITYSAIIYCLRCLVDRDVPLNQGAMAPIQVSIPHPSILHPTNEVGVVGGNVLTSQRVTDVILDAFGAAANSMGDMSNLTFGCESFGYYETIAGGGGAGPTWNGESGVQCHMTNTATTDVEVLERNFPVVLRQFALRTGSGGQGRWRGGDGIVREIEFSQDGLSVGILSERRALAPRGLAGGGCAARGLSIVTYADGRIVSLGGKNEVNVNRGDRIRIETPGGGGYGEL